MKYKIEVQETLSRIIEIEAKSEEGALKEVTKQYKNENIVLDANDYLETSFNIYKEN